MITKVLFLCTGNSARSQMAEAFLNAANNEQYQAFSAGLDPKGVNPHTIKVMAELGYDLSNNRSKGVEEFLNKQHVHVLITVCDNAEKRCPSIWPGVVSRLHWPIDDPSSVEGTEEEITAAFIKARDELKKRVENFLKTFDPKTIGE